MEPITRRVTDLGADVDRFLIFNQSPQLLKISLSPSVQHPAIMAMDFRDDDLDLYFSTATATVTASTTTMATTSSGGNQGYVWNSWSPLIDWDDDFQNLIDPMMVGHEALIFDPPVVADDRDQEACNLRLKETRMPYVIDSDVTESDDFKGLRLVHLLVAAAEALAGGDQTKELARVILARLTELVSIDDETNIDRLAANFTHGLSVLFERTGGINHQANHRKWRAGGDGGGPHRHCGDANQTDVVVAFQLLQDMSPYINFGYLTANQAILDAVEYDRRIHIVDYDIMEGVQWASFMQALVSKNSGLTTQHLKITALSRAVNGRKTIAAVQEAGRRLTAFAESLGISFSFHHCKLDSDQTFQPSALKLVKGEALVINCMLHLPRFSESQIQNSVFSFLTEVKTLNPRLVTLVEEEPGLLGTVGFVDRFMDLLYRFSAIFDSLDASFPIKSHARVFVERHFLGPWITTSVNRISTRYGEETESWSLRHWLDKNGFKPVDTSFGNQCQAKLLLGLFDDGYKVELLGSNRLTLGWKSRRLVSASVWTVSE